MEWNLKHDKAQALQPEEPRSLRTFSTAFCPHLQLGAHAADCASRRLNVRLMRARPLSGCALTLLLRGTCMSALA